MYGHMCPSRLPGGGGVQNSVDTGVLLDLFYFCFIVIFCISYN
jgi:hypothetical protein